MSVTSDQITELPTKNPALVVLPIACTGLVLFFILLPWMRRIDLLDPLLALLSFVNATIWVVVLWWAFHHLVFQLAALFRRIPQSPDQNYSGETKFAVLYLTCDDFQPNAVITCLRQDYPRPLYEVLICDDSSDQEYRAKIDQFAETHSNVRVVRRGSGRGFKAGNLNNAFSREIAKDVEWVIIVDADQSLPRNYLSALASVTVKQPRQVAFVQAAHDSDHHRSAVPFSSPEPVLLPTPFQQALGIEVGIFYHRDLAWRMRYGFMPFQGHGAAIRCRSWQDIGGFPELVSEDYAFTLRALTAGSIGIYAEHVRSWESFPQDFNSFLTRLRKFSGGSAELFRYEVRKFLVGPASFIEKFDFLMLLLWYPLSPVILFNAFLSAYVCHRLWIVTIPLLHPALPYLFAGMLLMTIPVLFSMTQNLFQAVRYWFWAVAVYGACLPIAACEFLVHIFAKPAFVRTPKCSERSKVPPKLSALMVTLGVSTLGLSFMWPSPFSFVLAAHGASYVSFPLYYFLAESSGLSWLSRIVVWLPGVLLIVALYAMWHSGKF